jgi:hypothetical protein
VVTHDDDDDDMRAPGCGDRQAPGCGDMLAYLRNPTRNKLQMSGIPTNGAVDCPADARRLIDCGSRKSIKLIWTVFLQSILEDVERAVPVSTEEHVC